MKITPNRGRVFVELVPIEEYTRESGIILPSKRIEVSRVGIIRAVASDVTNFKIDDKVFVHFISGTGVDYPALGYRYDVHKFFSEVEILGLVTD